MVKWPSYINGLVFIILGGILLTWNWWSAQYWFFQYLIPITPIVIGSALIGFGVRDLLLAFTDKESR